MPQSQRRHVQKKSHNIIELNKMEFSFLPGCLRANVHLRCQWLAFDGWQGLRGFVRYWTLSRIRHLSGSQGRDIPHFSRWKTDVTEVENRMMDLILDHVTYYVVPSYWSCHGKSYHGILRLLALRFDRPSLVSWINDSSSFVSWA